MGNQPADGQALETRMRQQVHRNERLYSGDTVPGQLNVDELIVKTSFTTDGGAYIDGQMQQHRQARGVGPLRTQTQVLAQQEIDRMQPTMTSLGLFRRRYTPATATINDYRMQQLEGEVSTEAMQHATQRKSELAPLSRRERKARKEELEAPEKQAFTLAKANVTSDFVDKTVVTSAWAKEHVLDKKVKIHKEDGSSPELTQEALLKEVLRSGDCSNLEVLDPVLRNLAACKYMEGISISTVPATPADAVNALFKKDGVSALMNPLFRIGLSILAKGGTLSGGVLAGKSMDFYAEMEDLCNQRIMSATMYSAPTADQSTDAVQRNHESQVFMAKNLLMCHLGKLQQIDTAPNVLTGDKIVRERDWSHGMATAFAHCSRIAVSLPSVTGGDSDMVKGLMGRKEGQRGGFTRRPMATHSLTRKSKTKAGSKLVEIKAKPTSMIGQYGMNVAVGGLGNEGVPGEQGQKRRIKNDGSGGHIYMHMEEGDSGTYTGYLVGFESDAPGVYNQTGHKHGAGNPEFMSSFGGLRTDEIGDKYGGRVADCSGFNGDAFEQMLTDFDHRFRALQIEAYTNTGKQGQAKMAELMQVCDLLSGAQMTDEQLCFVLGVNDLTQLGGRFAAPAQH